LIPIKAMPVSDDHHGESRNTLQEPAMLFTTPEPIAPPKVLDLIRAVQAVDALAEIRLDKTGRQVSIEGRLTAQQAASAIGECGLSGVIIPSDHVSGGSTCCGGCA